MFFQHYNIFFLENTCNGKKYIRSMFFQLTLTGMFILLF